VEDIERERGIEHHKKVGRIKLIRAQTLAHMASKEDKMTFYSKVEKSLTLRGYKYYDGDRDIRGKGRSHASKPDYIAVKNDTIIIGEIKSPSEPPTSSSWRQVQNSDTEGFKKVRIEVASREKAGEVSKEAGGHEIIIRGQIPDYVRKIGETYDLPEDIINAKKILCGYSVPSSETKNVEQALRNCSKTMKDKIDIGNGVVTYIFS